MVPSFWTGRNLRTGNNNNSYWPEKYAFQPVQQDVPSMIHWWSSSWYRNQPQSLFFRHRRAHCMEVKVATESMEPGIQNPSQGYCLNLRQPTLLAIKTRINVRVFIMSFLLCDINLINSLATHWTSCTS